MRGMGIKKPIPAGCRPLMGKWIIVIISVCVHVCFVDDNSKSKTAVC